MLLIKTNSKSAFAGSDIPVFQVSKAEEDLFNLGVSSWVETGQRFIRVDGTGKVTGLMDRATSDVLTPVATAPTIINAGIPVLRFAASPMLGNVDVFSPDSIQTVITVNRAQLGDTRTLIGSQAASNPLMVYVDTPDTAGIRYINGLYRDETNSNKAVKGIGWFSGVCSYDLAGKKCEIYVNGEKVASSSSVAGAISTSQGARKLAIGGVGVRGATYPGNHDFALCIVLPGIAAHNDASVMAKIQAFLAEFMAKLTA
ncbi:Uncharacterised protein [Klebsiella quasipneumoniae]|uniref:hypothetical protein n=1 Tax=Klebsiella quasipneumoniae TaxID=1463165 RepID=UPI000DE78D6B|nr:hypothetical protein [Klebsiella quasipneumoniae]SSG05554.1 Uncharacterised protein [Klebsiella quasipneumoniae]SSG65436.1 Uncharacterised protein [Klebsiella quasipneumoniae]